MSWPAPNEDLWLFAYGSLMWRPDIETIAHERARARGWCRRFWQGSHDHRGTPDAPGRVVTLIREPEASCDGVAWRIPAHALSRELPRLDHREKNGYERASIELTLQSGVEVTALAYIAPPGNFAWAGPEPEPQLAERIRRSVGPSGRNDEYVFELQAALARLPSEDVHVTAIAAALRDFATTAG